jgi:hypothetical protein
MNPSMVDKQTKAISGPDVTKTPSFKDAPMPLRDPRLEKIKLK